ncbi:MAG: 4-hydroxybenzoate octaprenyltransferase [Rhodospirillales bacterium]|nr:4-hydroxybenzoate octaprenyltransferase [Rhodospirillales bacterium]
MDHSYGTKTDIRGDSIILRAAPAALRPYLRLARVDRPIGTWLLLLPGWWSIALASDSWPDPWLLLLFAIGALVMRGAGCTLNDIADRHFDAKVARTATRPIPAGEVSVLQAFVFMGTLCLVGLVILLQFNAFAIVLGVASLALVAVYPFMKRITYWPQACLGLTFNWGALLGWATVRGDLEAPAIALYVGGLFWTLGYDTIYAHQDKEDDVLVGVRSTALRLGEQTKPIVSGFYAMAVALFLIAGHASGLGLSYLVAIVLVSIHFTWQVLFVDLDDPKDCLKVFKSNRDLALILFVGIVFAQVLG